MDAMDWDANPGNGRRAIVTGGAGFLGCHLCAKLLEQGFEVTAIDNLSTDSLHCITPHARFRFRRHDIVSPATLRADWTFNLACCASPHEAEKTIGTCTDGVLNMLHEGCAAAARIVHASVPMVS